MNPRAPVAWLIPLSLLVACSDPGSGTTTEVTTVAEESGTSGTGDSLTGSETSSATNPDPSTSESGTTTTSDPTEGTESTGPGDESSESSTAAESESSSGVAPFCGDGNVDEGEDCDDMNDDDTDDCVAGCVAAACGDGFVQAGVEPCDDGNALDTDACLTTCAPATCGDGFVLEGTEECDDANASDGDACLSSCVAASCGDGEIYEGVEQCDGNGSCDDSCNIFCTNDGGGALMAENGTGDDVYYCYNAVDSVETRALKACESHFGIGTCCVIPEGYNEQQYGQCGAGGGAGTYHWHPDVHPDGHCDPLYVVGDVVAPGWCGFITGNFLD